MMPNQSDIVYSTPDQPKQVRLDTTTSCNARCLSCHRFLTTRNGKMQWSLIKQLVEDIARWTEPLYEIVPVNYGEFFSLVNWPDVLRLIRNKLPQTQVVIPTNGSLLSPIMVTILWEVPNVKMMNFSVNAYFDETYERFMGLPASNIRHVEAMIKLIKVQRPDIKIWVSMVFDPEYQTDKEKQLFEEHWKPLADKVWILSASSANRPEKIPTIVNEVPCRSIFSDLVVGFDGKLSSCCFDAGFTIDCGGYTGDLRRDWRNPKLEALRKAHNEHRRTEYELCRSCTSA